MSTRTQAPTPSKRGRPLLYDERTVLVNTNIPKTAAERLEERARKQGITRSQLVARICLRYLAKK